MGFWLEAQHDGVDGVMINYWNWRATIALLHREGVLDDETFARCGFQSGVEIDAATARRAAEVIEALLVTVPEDGRLLLDGDVTTEPDDFQVHGDSRDYSATRSWLVEFVAFARASGGFTVG